MPSILVGTANGLQSFTPDGARSGTQLEGRDVRAVAPAGWRRLWAIVDGREIWSADVKGPWGRVVSFDDLEGAEGLEAKCLADTRANDEDGILVGTSEARLLRVTGAGRLEVVPGFEEAPGRDDWYTPWGGPPDTRSISEDGERVYVNVHVGGILRSADRGTTWEPTIDIDSDVHRVVTGDGRVYAAGAHGLSVSEDGGATWRLSAEGLHATYSRGVAVCGSHILLSASTGPSSHRAALYRSGLAGESFEKCVTGLPEWFEGNLDSPSVDALPGGELAAFGSEDGELYASADQGASWTRVANGLGYVNCVLTLP